MGESYAFSLGHFMGLEVMIMVVLVVADAEVVVDAFLESTSSAI